MSVSIGVATFPRDGLTADAILLAADRACFVAKRTGPGLIATADEGLAIASEFAFKEPTPIDVAEPADRPVGELVSNGAIAAGRGTRGSRGNRPRKPLSASTDASPVP